MSEPLQVSSAREVVLGSVRGPLTAEPVPLAEARGRVLAADQRAPEDVPGFDNSAMDGFAVRAADTLGAAPEMPVVLPVRGESRAGAPAEAAQEGGEAYRISTGAAVPAGADAVVRQEDAREVDGGIEIKAPVAAGRDIRRAGEDIRAGEVVLRPGTRIGAAEAGVLASLGVPEPECVRRPRLALVCTGDELLGPEEPMRPGGVRNSNAYTVPALASDAGAQVVSVERCADDAGATRDALERALDADVAVICGGVSVGPHDHVKGALAELGAEERFWGVALRPGRPTWFGTRGDCLVFGLPGNPVSAFVTFVLFVRPAISALLGSAADTQTATATLAGEVPRLPARDQAVRCALELTDRGWVATPTGPQGSHILTSMLGADALAVIAAGEGAAPAGSRVEVELLR